MANHAVCTPKSLPRGKWVAAAQRARQVNALNHAPVAHLLRIAPSLAPTPEHLALVTTKYWGQAGVKLTVGFLEQTRPDLRARILSHMNAWSSTANVSFAESGTDPQVRISFEQEGYWSYVGTDILSIDPSEPTMNLQGFTMNTDDSEFYRVVRHETGHTLGFPHEHMRKELVNRIDAEKAIAYFAKWDGWSREEVIQQVLTPLNDATLIETPHADPDSIMCYQIPGEITKDGEPILGGIDIDASDFAFASRVYPKLQASDSIHASPISPEEAVLVVAAGTNPAYVASLFSALHG